MLIFFLLFSLIISTYYFLVSRETFIFLIFLAFYLQISYRLTNSIFSRFLLTTIKFPGTNRMQHPNKLHMMTQFSNNHQRSTTESHFKSCCVQNLHALINADNPFFLILSNPHYIFRKTVAFLLLLFLFKILHKPR